MSRDRTWSVFVGLLEEEKKRLVEDVLENDTLSVEELRRSQGIYRGLKIARDLLDAAVRDAEVE
jgi:hypothetical protein